MNQPENTIQDPSEEANLKQQVAELSRQMDRLYFGLVIVSLMLAAFVGVQARRADKDLEQVRPNANRLLETNKKEAPAIETFVSQLGTYGQGHPDYAEKVLAKYGIKAGAVPPLGSAPAGVVPKK